MPPTKTNPIKLGEKAGKFSYCCVSKKTIPIMILIIPTFANQYCPIWNSNESAFSENVSGIICGSFSSSSLCDNSKCDSILEIRVSNLWMDFITSLSVSDDSSLKKNFLPGSTLQIVKNV